LQSDSLNAITHESRACSYSVQIAFATNTTIAQKKVTCLSF